MLGQRTRWMGTVAAVTVLHFIVNTGLGIGSKAALWWTDVSLVVASAIAVTACVSAARSQSERHNRIAWLALAIGVAGWLMAAVVWSARDLVFSLPAPAPSWRDVPFFLLAPTFAVALVVYRRQRASRTLQLRQIADLGILTAAITIAGTLVLAPSLRRNGFSPYVIVAIGYPGFYLAVVLAALGSLGRGAWGPRGGVLGVLIWANLAFAAVDVLYGAKVLVDIYQTGIEDTLWLLGFSSMCWASAEERALASKPAPIVDTAPGSSWNAVVGASALIAISALAALAIRSLEGVEWTIIAVAVIATAGFVGLRMWTGDRTEDAYLDAVAVGEETERALTAERALASRLRGASSLADGTAHEVNNLLQAIAGSVALLRRRAARGEDLSTYAATIDDSLARLAKEVNELRKLSPSETTHGMILIVPGGDRNGRLAAVLAGAGFAPASLPTIEAAPRAAKSHGVRAIVASHGEADVLSSMGVTIPIVRRRDTDDILDAVVEIVRIVSDAELANRV